jgi:RNA polymerase sigma factor (sigma-70 family)
MRSEQEVNRAIDEYSDTIFRICLIHLKNKADAEDVFQEVFMKYALSDKVYENSEHEKAWIIRVALNACKDLIKSFFRSKTVSIDELVSVPCDEKEDFSGVLDAVLKLPEKYRDVIYLHYYEGYSAYEIGKILNKKENTVYSLLSRGREMLKKHLGGD